MWGFGYKGLQLVPSVVFTTYEVRFNCFLKMSSGGYFQNFQLSGYIPMESVAFIFYAYSVVPKQLALCASTDHHDGAPSCSTTFHVFPLCSYTRPFYAWAESQISGDTLPIQWLDSHSCKRHQILNQCI